MSASAVHTLDVAFSRLMCCSRVWSANLNAGRSYASLLIPMMRPGISLLYSSFAAKYAAYGPPNPIGIPQRCVLPKQMSAPHVPGALSSAKLIRSAITATLHPFSCAFAAKSA